MEDVKENIEKASGKALSTMMSGASMVVSALAILRHLDRYVEPRRALRFLGFRRRRSFGASAAVFGAGVLAGAGIAMLVSPTSGRQTRQGMARGVRSIGHKGRELLRSAGAEVKEEIGLLKEEGQKSREQGNGHDQGAREQAQHEGG